MATWKKLLSQGGNKNVIEALKQELTGGGTGGRVAGVLDLVIVVGSWVADIMCDCRQQHGKDVPTAELKLQKLNKIGM